MEETKFSVTHGLYTEPTAVSLRWTSLNLYIYVHIYRCLSERMLSSLFMCTHIMITAAGTVVLSIGITGQPMICVNYMN